MCLIIAGRIITTKRSSANIVNVRIFIFFIILCILKKYHNRNIVFWTSPLYKLRPVQTSQSFVATITLKMAISSYTKDIAKLKKSLRTHRTCFYVYNVINKILRRFGSSVISRNKKREVKTKIKISLIVPKADFERKGTWLWDILIGKWKEDEIEIGKEVRHCNEHGDGKR